MSGERYAHEERDNEEMERMVEHALVCESLHLWL